jgi:hypothetical protein
MRRKQRKSSADTPKQGPRREINGQRKRRRVEEEGGRERLPGIEVESGRSQARAKVDSGLIQRVSKSLCAPGKTPQTIH